MELLIRSQSKLSLVEAKDLNAIEIEGKWHIVKLNVLLDLEHRIELGIYATKERALEVLDEIQSRLDDFVNSDYLKNVTDVSKQVYIAPFIVYEMPKE